MFWAKNNPVPEATMLFGCSPPAEITRTLTIFRSALGGPGPTAVVEVPDVADVPDVAEALDEVVEAAEPLDDAGAVATGNAAGSVVPCGDDDASGCAVDEVQAASSARRTAATVRRERRTS
jgi:hypothetical protein